MNPVIITVNGKRIHCKDATITYRAVVGLALEKPFDKVPRDKVYSVTYHHGSPSKPSGTLAKGETVVLYEGMIFNVADTSSA